jgi:hypothetical protein
MLSMEELLVLTCVGPDGVQQRESYKYNGTAYIVEVN